MAGCAKLKASSGGAVAQLGARLDGIEEVVGSNPIGSTKLQNIQSAKKDDLPVYPACTSVGRFCSFCSFCCFAESIT